MLDFIVKIIQLLLPLIGTSIAVFLMLYAAHWLLLRRRPELRREHKLPRQLAMLGLTVIGLVSLTLALPVEPSMRNQVLTLIGVLLSGLIAFSSTTVVANLMAGLMLRATKSFRVGDFIRVGEHFGRVTEHGLFDTEIQSENRELVSLANALLIAQPISVVRSSGAIISGTLSLGYDLNHARIQPLLVKAARQAGLEDPFVQITELGNYAVTYRVSGLLTEVKSMISARSILYRMILDSLHEDGVEIMSPTFMNQRPVGEHTKIIPQAMARRKRQAETSNLEAIVFDKAEESERREKESRRLQEEIKRLDEQLKTLEGEVRQSVQESIDQRRAELLALDGEEDEK